MQAFYENWRVPAIQSALSAGFSNHIALKTKRIFRIIKGRVRMKKPLQWHPAFQAVLQIEFAEEAKYLQFLKEYNLTDSPLRVDTLIIKVETGVKIQKKIGRIFRGYNIIEYNWYT